MIEEKLNFKGLRYNGFSVVYMQIFGLARCSPELFNSNIQEIVDSDTLESNRATVENGVSKKHQDRSQNKKDIDKQIFVIGEEGSPVRRFKLPDFEFSLQIEKDDDLPYSVDVRGKVAVEMSIFFNKTVILTFNMMVDNKERCFTSASLTTDHLISLASLNLGGEHWNSPEEGEGTASNINLKVYPVSITNLYLDENGEWLKTPVAMDTAGGGEDCEDNNAFAMVCERYKKAILKSQKAVTFRHQNFVYLDIWENVDNESGELQRMKKEEDIITYIADNCKKELVGLMTLYPKEWPYRTEESFYDVCGRNIAIDTDDLILLNSSMCVVFGTYGRRAEEGGTNWQKHLALRKTYYVSWPEYMLILEMILAKKYTIAAARDFLIRSTKVGKTPSSARESIELNASVELIITQLLLNLDAVNYSKFMSHKIMFDRTTKRLEIERDENNLKEVMAKVENSLSNLSKMRSLKQAEAFNIILGGISIASLFQVIFANIEVPFLVHLGCTWAGNAGLTLVTIAIFLVFAGIISLSIVAIQNRGMGLSHLVKKSYKKILNKERIDPEF